MSYQQQIFINLPVKDLNKSVAFFTALGYKFNPQFTDETATCMIISDTIYAMLLTHPKFSGFAPHPVADAHKTTEVIIALNCSDRAAVDALVDKAIANGGTKYKEAEDLGFMYNRAYQDLDGHVWEVFHMDMSQFPQQ